MDSKSDSKAQQSKIQFLLLSELSPQPTLKMQKLTRTRRLAAKQQH